MENTKVGAARLAAREVEVRDKIISATGTAAPLLLGSADIGTVGARLRAGMMADPYLLPVLIRAIGAVIDADAERFIAAEMAKGAGHADMGAVASRLSSHARARRMIDGAMRGILDAFTPAAGASAGEAQPES